jgi:hypothetical protein
MTTKIMISLVGAQVVAAGFAIFAAAQDLDLDFRSLKLGLSREAVVNMLGNPVAEIESPTLSIKYRQLLWVDPTGRRYTASFVFDRLFRWKKCSPRVRDC